MVLLWVPLLLGATAQPAAALTIIPSFDSTITGDPNAAAIESAIQLAITPYAAFTDPVTVNILYQASHAGTSAYLGESGSAFWQQSYAAYTGNLSANAAAFGNPIAQSAVAHLPTPGNELAQSVLATSADMRALGCATCTGNISNIDLASNTLVYGGSYDGAIAINLSQPLQFSRNGDGSISGGSYDAISVIQHETDEVLGIGGSGSILNDVGSGSSPPTINSKTTIGALDLFRYSAAGIHNLTTSGSAYFSVDGGTTDIANFNQNGNGDYGDWLLGTGHVQDAFTPSGQVANFSLTSPEGLALQAIGYDIPEPASLVLLGAGAVLLAGLRPRRWIAA